MLHMSLRRNPATPVKAPKSYVDSLPRDNNLSNLKKEQEELDANLKAEFGAIKHADEDNLVKYKSFVLPSKRRSEAHHRSNHSLP